MKPWDGSLPARVSVFVIVAVLPIGLDALAGGPFLLEEHIPGGAVSMIFDLPLPQHKMIPKNTTKTPTTMPKHCDTLCGPPPPPPKPLVAA